MPYDIWPDPIFGEQHTGGRRSTYALSSETGHHGSSEASQGDPSELFLAHVDPEDEAGLLAEEHGPEGPQHHPRASSASEDEPPENPPEQLDESALAAFIASQAREQGVDLLAHAEQRDHVCFPTEAVRHVSDLLGQLASNNPEQSRQAIQELIALRDPLGARVAAAEDPGASNLQRSASLYLHLRELFKKVEGEHLVARDLVWPVPGGSDPSVRTAGRDLEEYYRLRFHKPPIPGIAARPRRSGRHPRPRGTCDETLIVRHGQHALFEELETLRNRTGGRLLNLYSDWRNWLAWLRTDNPILCLAWMNQHLARPRRGEIAECYDPAEIEHDRAQRVFLVVGYEITEDREKFQKIVRDVANGAQSHRDLPIRYRLRNSWNPDWGDHGHAWIKHRDLSRQFGQGSALLLPETELPGSSARGG